MRRRLVRGIIVALALIVGACATQAPQTPPGAHWVVGKLCGEDDCDNIPGRWRALADVDLYARAEEGAPVVARVASGEWVHATDKRTLYVPDPEAPRRTMWVRIEPGEGRVGGWARDPQDFACMGEHPASDEGC